MAVLMPLIAETPDVEGFLAAQTALREKLGSPVTFRIPTAPKWPGGTKLNSITKLPYDATVVQENPPWEDIIKTCLVILKQGSPLRPQSDTEVVALGEVSGMDIILDVAETDYKAVEHAKEMVVSGLTYDIREAKPFTIAGTVYRRLVYGEQR